MKLPLAVAVAAGGAIGAVARYLFVGGFDHWFGAGFPVGTLAANALGSLAMGLFIEVTALLWSPSPEVRALFVVGVLGSFTTFSTFSMETLILFERGATGQAALYVLGSVVLSLAGIFAGMRVSRSVLS